MITNENFYFSPMNNFSFIDNFESIMSNGILAKNDIKQKKLITKSFADVDVQNFRKDIFFEPLVGLIREKYSIDLNKTRTYLKPKTRAIE